MKKLIVAAFCAAFAVAANAASVLWMQTDPTIKDSSSAQVADNCTVYLINAAFSDTSFASAWAGSGISAAISAAGANVVSSSGYTLEGMVVADDAATYSTRDFRAYYVIVDDVNEEIFISDTIAATLDPMVTEASTFEFGSSSSTVVKADKYAGGAAWIQAAGDVPEPTSGLLLLLGMAGLALRRRRA